MRGGYVNRQLVAERIVIEELLEHENVKLFSFNDNFDLITDLDNYKDMTHYGEWVNSWILEQMSMVEKGGECQYLLTKENYEDYLKTVQQFYNSYDYESLHTPGQKTGGGKDAL